jgi:hypothetical protein
LDLALIITRQYDFGNTRLTPGTVAG